MPRMAERKGKAVYNVKPGDKAVIINSANGPNGASVGRTVLVHADAPKSDYDAQYAEKYNELNDPTHYCPPSPYEKEHSTLGKIWPVTCVKGGTFMSEHGGFGLTFIDVPDRWLRKLVEPPAKTQERKELLKL